MYYCIVKRMHYCTLLKTNLYKNSHEYAFISLYMCKLGVYMSNTNTDYSYYLSDMTRLYHEKDMSKFVLLYSRNVYKFSVSISINTSHGKLINNAFNDLYTN